MEGRVLLTCSECGRTREVAGEMPEEYTNDFAKAVRDEGWVPRPGATSGAFIDGECLRRGYAGHETVDDEEKVQGRRDPMEP